MDKINHTTKMNHTSSANDKAKNRSTYTEKITHGTHPSGSVCFE